MPPSPPPLPPSPPPLPPSPPPLPPPPPLPSPPPIPGQSGPQTVVVNVPPDLVDKFAPHGLTGPWATLIAAAVALIGAAIAFWAVNRQIKANGKAVAAHINANAAAVTAQIDANAAAVAEQIEAAAAHQRRAERLDVVTEAAHLVHDLSALATQHAAYAGDPEWLDEPSAVAQGRVEDKFDEITVWPLARRLDLLGMTAAAEAVEEVYHEASRVIRPSGYEETDEGWTIYDKKDRAILALKDGLDGA